MSIEVEQKLIADFRPKAIAVCDHVKAYHTNLIKLGRGVYSNDGNLWNGWAFMDFFNTNPWTANPFTGGQPHYGILPDGNRGIIYPFNEWCYVGFNNFRPKDGAPYTSHKSEPEFLNKRIVGIGRESFPNETDRDQPINKTFTEKTEITIANATHIGAKVASSLRQQFSYGSELIGAEGETEISLSIEAELATDSSYSKTESIEETYTWDGYVKSGHVLHLSRQREIGRFKQSIETTGLMDFTIWVYSEGDFTVRWDSTDEANRCLSGIGSNRDVDGIINWGWLYNKEPIYNIVNADHQRWLIDTLCSPIHTTVHESFEFEHAKTAKNIISEVAISA